MQAITRTLARLGAGEDHTAALMPFPEMRRRIGFDDDHARADAYAEGHGTSPQDGLHRRRSPRRAGPHDPARIRRPLGIGAREAASTSFPAALPTSRPDDRGR